MTHNQKLNRIGPRGRLDNVIRSIGFGAVSIQTVGGGAGVADETQSYHGYIYKVLTRQGEHAPGGEFNYVLNGNMVAGFALVAYPAQWGSSGVMTFAVNSNGRIYEKNLEEDTAQVVNSIGAHDPDETWRESDHR